MEYAGQSKQVKQKLLICGLLSETEFWLVVIVVTVVTARMALNTSQSRTNVHWSATAT